jgi:hypothetical protein
MILSDKNITKAVDFFSDLFGSIFTLVKVVAWSRPMRLPILDANECIILGNGPSLARNLEEDFDILSKKILMCVNFFPRSPYFLKLKPKILTICDPHFWENYRPSATIEERNEFFDLVVKLVDWKMMLFIPMRAKSNKPLIANLRTNKNIGLYFYNSTPITGFTAFKNFMFRYKLGMPRPRNVLIPSIHLAILLNFRKVLLLGAEHNWFEDLYVDENNSVMINIKHFYEKKTESRPFLLFGTEKARMYEILKQFYHVFYSYFDLKEFARVCNVEIVNCTPVSHIDAFKKQSLRKAVAE